MDHIRFEDYLAALLGASEFSSLDQRTHRHLLDLCGDCGIVWQRLLNREESGAGAPELRVPPVLPEDERELSLDFLALIERLLLQSREEARFARDDLHRLLRLPMDRWQQRVARARTRFRSRAFAEFLVEEARRRVRTSPRQAALLVELVPTALSRLPESGRAPWSEALIARAAAHRANALRIAGDLPAAEAAFTTLRQAIAEQPLRDQLIEAEIDSLESSLRFDQRNFRETDSLLTRLERTYHRMSDLEGLLATSIKRASLLRTMGRAGQALSLLTRAAKLVDRTDSAYLRFCVVNGRVNALIDLDRPMDAEVVLAAERGAYFESGDDHTAALHRFMRARIDLGLGRLAGSVAGFESTRDQFLALDRDYDAAFSSLYLADALLAAGRTSDLRRLATDLVPLFHSRGVKRETLASLRPFAQAV